MTRYSDGTVDRIDREFNESGEVSKEAETRQNGVSCTTQYTYDTNKSSMTQVFRNGYQVDIVYDESKTGTDAYYVSYSAGDVVQDIFTETETLFYSKNIYRDGKEDKISIDLSDCDGYSAKYEQMDEIDNRYYQFMEQAWASQAPAETGAATSSDAALTPEEEQAAI